MGAVFPLNFISKKQSEKSKTSQSSTTKQISQREEKIKADKDRRPDDIYNSRHLFGVAVPVNHLTDSWYSSHKVKTNNKIRIFFSFNGQRRF